MEAYENWRENQFQNEVDPNIETTYFVEIWDNTSYLVYEEDVTEDRMIELVKPYEIDTDTISRDNINLCESKGVSIQITPYNTFYDPKDI